MRFFESEVSRIGQVIAATALAAALSLGSAGVAEARYISAPGCVQSSQFPHSGIVSGKYTNVYLANTCGYATKVKIVMRHGYDSGCISLARDASGVKFRSRSNDGFQPSLTRLEKC